MVRSFIARGLNNKIKIWQIHDTVGGYTIKYGNFGENLIVKFVTYTESQIVSRIKKKLKKGYVAIVTIEGATYDTLNRSLPTKVVDNNNNLKAMKCQKFKINKFKYPAIAQPKINGIRAFIVWGHAIINEGMFMEEREQPIILSMEGNRYHLPMIEKMFTKAMFDGIDAYDGELYVPGLKLNQIRSCIPMENANGVVSKVSGNPDLVNFWCFDVADDNSSQEDRVSILGDCDLRTVSFEQSNALEHFDNTNRIVMVGDTYVNNDAESIAFADKCIALGYEGAVIRDLNAEYAFGSRPKSMMKIKKFMDAEFVVIDVVPKPNELGTGMFVCKNDINDNTFTCNPEGNYKQREEYLDNKDYYIGKLATVKFYERSGVKEVPFHANVVTIRDYE